MQEQFIDHLLGDIVVPRALSLGGGVNCGFVAARRGSVTDADRADFDCRVRRWPDIVGVEVGPLRDAWYDEAP